MKRYYVYLIEFSDGVQYVGCTNNLIRRKQQHNERGRNCSSKLGRYLHDHNIILGNDDLKVIAIFTERKEALATERKIALEKDKCGIVLLNDNFTSTCTRKGKNIGNTFKEFILIDFVNGTHTYVKDLRHYCEIHNLNYKNIQRTATVKFSHTLTGMKAFRVEDWDSMSKDEQTMFLNGSFVTNRIKEVTDAVKKRQSKTYLVRTPLGDVEEVTNLDAYAKAHGINAGNLHNSIKANRSAGGYKVIKRI